MRIYHLIALTFAMLVMARNGDALVTYFSCNPTVCRVEMAGDGYYAQVFDFGICSQTDPRNGNFYTVFSQADIGVASNCYSIVAVNISGGIHFTYGAGNGVYAGEDAIAFDPFSLANIGEATYFQYWDCGQQNPVATGGGNYPC
jgi:hypothetical protein